MNITVDHIISRLTPNPGICLLTASLLMCTTSIFAESGNYRVEVLVFSHLDGGSRPQEFEEIRSFSAHPELG